MARGATALQVERKNGRLRKGWEPQRRKRKMPCVPQDHHLRFVAQGDSARNHSVRARRPAARVVVLSPGVHLDQTRSVNISSMQELNFG